MNDLYSATLRTVIDLLEQVDELLDPVDLQPSGARTYPGVLIQRVAAGTAMPSSGARTIMGTRILNEDGLPRFECVVHLPHPDWSPMTPPEEEGDVAAPHTVRPDAPA